MALLLLLSLIFSPQRSSVVPVGAIAPAFSVSDDRGAARSLSEFKGKNYIDAALTELLAGKPVAMAASIPYGCEVHYAINR